VQALLYDAMEQEGAQVAGYSRGKLLRESWDVWHLHWPLEHVVSGTNVYATMRRLLTFSLALKMARLKKTKIFWTVHNIRGHEQSHPLLEWMFWRIFLANIDGIICMSEIGRRELCRRHPQTQSIQIFTIPHGHYRGAYPDVISKGQARTALDIPADRFVALFIGQVRAYKGVLKLIRSFAAAQLADATLVVAGAADDQTACAIKQAAAPASNVRLALEFVGRDDMQKYLRAADLVILPYTEILNSGSAILALSFDRPVLVPDRGALAELARIVGPDWVSLYEGELGPEIIRAAVRWTKARPFASDARAALDALNWERIARLTIQAFS